MKKMNLKNKKYPLGAKNFWLGFSCLFLTSCSKVVDTAGQFLIKLQETYVAVTDLTMALCYLFGTGFVIKSIFSFKQYGEQRTMMSSQTTIRTPVTYLSVGLAFLYLPALVSIFSNSAFGQPVVNLIGFQNDIDTSENIKNAVYALVQVVGFISMVRAIFIASNPHPNPGQGGLPKAAIHFLAGLLAVNVSYVMSLVQGFI